MFYKVVSRTLYDYVSNYTH